MAEQKNWKRWKATWQANRLYIFVAGYVFSLFLLAWLGYIEISRIQGETNEKSASVHENVPASKSSKAFYGLPRMELTLSSFQGETHHARIGISLEIEKRNMERFMDFQPRVSDQIINFLRQQDIDEIRKPTSMYDLRRDLLLEVNKVSGPIPVTDIIFREFVVR